MKEGERERERKGKEYRIVRELLLTCLPYRTDFVLQNTPGRQLLKAQDERKVFFLHDRRNVERLQV